MLFKQKTPYEKELELLRKKELAFLGARLEKKDNIINKNLEGRVPEKLQNTLDAAFAKAFELIFEKGTGIIDKTYMKAKAEERYIANEAKHEYRQTRRTLKAFSRKASGTSNKNLILSGTAGIGMGALGIGIPDIPVFTGMMLKAIYEIATSYGYKYDTEEERVFILKIIEAALSYGDEMVETDGELNKFINTGDFPGGYDRKLQIIKTSEALSKELLYMKFLQGIPVVGAVGGIYDAIYMKRITEYANLKYKRRFLNDKK